MPKLKATIKNRTAHTNSKCVIEKKSLPNYMTFINNNPPNTMFPTSMYVYSHVCMYGYVYIYVCIYLPINKWKNI